MDRNSWKTALKPTCPAAWRLAAAVAAVFVSFIFGASSASAATEATTSLTNRIVCTTAPVNYNADGNPARVFVAGDFVYVLEQWNARVAVYDLVGRTNLFYYGATAQNGAGMKYTDSSKWKISNGDGGFTKPFGMALDTSSGNRFAVADTENNRVQLFTFDPATGEITFVAASEKLFYQPFAVAFTESGDILVADKGNKRVVRLSSALAQTAEYPLGENAVPTGICADSDTSDGFWITDSKNQRVAYYRIADGTSTPVVQFGTVAGKEFTTPSDVQIFGDSDNGKFLCVVDSQGSRVRIVDAVVSGGAYTDVLLAGDVGATSDASLQEYEKLWRPNGVFVDSDSGILYVADYGNNLIKWYEVTPETPEPPEPPPTPTEEYEEVQWHIDSIAVTNGTTTLTWSFPQENVPASGECMFRIEWRTSLTEGAWSAPADSYTVENVATVAGCTKSIPLSALGNPPHCFFRLFWTNKVKE